jgi:hypothetical protein
MPKPPSFVALPPRPDSDFVRTTFRRIQNHFADTECSCMDWIAFTFGKSPHTSGFTHFHHGKFFPVDPSVARLDRATERIVRLAFEPATAARIADRFSGTLTAVCHRDDFDLRIGKDRRVALWQCFGPTSRAFSVPLNLSGAIKMRIGEISSAGVPAVILSEAAAKSKDPVALSNLCITGFLDFARNDKPWLPFEFSFENFSHNRGVGFPFGKLDHLSFEKI